jgi:hypothetical protein
LLELNLRPFLGVRKEENEISLLGVKRWGRGREIAPAVDLVGVDLMGPDLTGVVVADVDTTFFRVVEVVRARSK